MISREELQAYQDDKANIEDISRRIEEIKTKLYDLNSVQTDRPKVLSSWNGGSAMEKAVERYTDDLERLKLQYVEQCAELTRRCAGIEAELSKLPSRCQLIMRAHYFDGIKWEVVADQNYWSLSTVDRLHKKALALLKAE